MRRFRFPAAAIAAFVVAAGLVFGQGGGISSGSAGSLRYGAIVPANCVTARGEVFFKTTAPVGINQCIANLFVPVLTATSGVASFNGRTGAVTLTSGDVTTALAYTPENPANKNASSGYAGLSGGKVGASQLLEVLGIADLTTYTGVSGSGGMAIAATITSPLTNQVLSWSGTNWINRALTSGDVTTALAFTPENAANKNASNGYAGLSSGKVGLSQLQEVLGVADLTDYAATSGTGTTAIKATLTSLTTNQVLTWSGSDWINQTASGGVAPFDSTHPDAHPASPNVADDEFDVGTSLDTAGTRHASAVPWVWANQGTGATANYANNLLILDAGAAPGGATIRISAIRQTISGTFKVRAKVQPMFVGPIGPNISWVGLFVQQSSNDKFNVLRFVMQSSFHWQIAQSGTAAIYATDPAGTVDGSQILPYPESVYLEIEEDSTNRMYRFSLSGATGSFVTVRTETKTTNVTTDRVGIMVGIQGTTIAVQSVCDFFRRLS